jgi:hypothetical protein
MRGEKSPDFLEVTEEHTLTSRVSNRSRFSSKLRESRFCDTL